MYAFIKNISIISKIFVNLNITTIIVDKHILVRIANQKCSI